MSFYGELQRRNVIRVGIAYLATGWLLLQVASVLLPVFEAPGWVAKAIVLLLALGFLPALIFAWVYELTPEGLRRDVDIEPSESLTRETGKKLNVITILVVVTGVIVTLGSRWFPTEAPVHSDRSVVGNTPTPEEQSIAILPFVNMSAGEDTGYFSDGLTETLLHIVAQNRELKVAARTSSFAFKGKDVDVRKIAQDLNVAHVLEGSVQRSGDRVRITAQLIRAEDGFHVWSGKFDRTLEDIFAIQDEIATRVGTELARSITGDGGQRPLSTHNVAAYDLYLRGLSAMASGSYQALLDAEGFLKRAVAADPDFLEARTSLAVVIYRQVGTGLRSPSSLSDVIAIVERNLELAPNDPRSEALLLGANLSSQFWNGDLDMNAGEEQFLALLRDAGSDVMVRMMYSTTYYEASPKRVEKVLREALEFDPLNADVHLYLGRAIMWQDREDEAIPVLKRALEIEPGAPNAFMSLGDAYGRAGKAREMVEAYLGSIEADPRDPELPARTASKLYELGLLEPADELVAKAAAIAPTSPVTINAQLAGLVARKDHEATQRFALEHIEKNIQNRQWAFPNTVRRYLNAGMRLGRLDASVKKLLEVRPEIAAAGQDPTSAVKYLASSFEVLKHVGPSLPKEQLEGALASIQLSLERSMVTEEKNPEQFAQIARLSGDIERAAALMKADFERYNALVGDLLCLSDPTFDEIFQHPLMAPAVAEIRSQQERYAADIAPLFEK